MIARVLAFSSLAMLGLMAGFFYAFSVCAMPGLDRIDPGEAIRAMQAINVAVHNPVFFVTFFLTPVVCLAGTVGLWLTDRKGAAVILACAALVYFLGAMVPTALVNVPMNRQLAALDTSGLSDAARIWSDYLPRWTWWNTFRTLASTVALILAGAALHLAGAASGAVRTGDDIMTSDGAPVSPGPKRSRAPA